MVNDELMLKIENVSKIYKLGEIGGTTLRDELQRLGAKIRHKPDPTKKVGAKNYNKGEKFKALANVSFEVKKGERIGIIGHNGAGKSTLLKLISRVTGPTEGNIYLNGRIASMLEVGTGFHGELTGRENIYMNGAILGMTKKEIDSKMEEIIEFSEVRQFIDTPVKRYSSGMYVKLAFSVAAHLNSEIMIMDEVLAVGDVAFQNKCLKKMRDVSEQYDKTILYVSHNMNTIRQLCDRVIVLNCGRIVFDGDVEEGIKKYLSVNKINSFPTYYDVSMYHRQTGFGEKAKITEVSIINKKQAIFEREDKMVLSISLTSNVDISNSCFLVAIKDENLNKIGVSISDRFNITATGKQSFLFEFCLAPLTIGEYNFNIVLCSLGDYENIVTIDEPGLSIPISMSDRFSKGLRWETKWWGRINFPTMRKII